MSCSLSRSQSCCSLSRSVLEAESRVDDHRGFLPPPSKDFVTRTVDEVSGEVRIKRQFHEHPLVLSTYLKVDENVDEFNFCCFCNKIYFTLGEPIYTCHPCYMCMHQSCGELPLWVHSTRHPQHELKLTVSTTYADCVDGRRGKERILTTAYECAICHYSVGIKEALHCISISLFKNSYLNRATTPSSLPLRLNEITGLSSSSIKVVSREIVHFYHAHPLILSMYEVHEENERCQLCRCYFTKVETIYSCCKGCNFSLHKSCAGLPEFIKTTLHPAHLLKFMPPVERNSCKGCGTIIDMSPRYTCQCIFCFHFNLHFLCALDSSPKNSLLGKNRYLLRTNPKATTTPYLSRSLSFPMEDKRKSQIIFSEPPPQKDSRGISLTLSSFFNFQLAENAGDQILHLCHKHPLVFTVFKMEYISIYYGICGFCDGTIHPDDPIYACHECEFFVHESCAKIPQTMRSTWHPAHMLQLMPTEYDLDCQLCNQLISSSWNNYVCDECGIYFHCGCVAAYSFEDHKAQEHTFHYFKASTFTCDACGITETKERFSCICTSCPMQVHKHCSDSFPRTVKQKRHHHKLNLTYFFEVDFDYANEICKICFNQMNKVYCLYKCHDCSYMAHVKCATSKDIVEEESVVDESVVNESVVNKIGELAVGEGQKDEHFSHAHPLVFTKEEPTKIDAYCDAGGDLIFTEEEEPTKFEAFCDACVSPISAPFYACATDDQCNFYLHKRCFELRLEIQHPLHKHRLTLTSTEDFFKCYGCGVFCNGFKYSCEKKCQFYLDVRCSLLSDTLKHDGHDCTLTLIDYFYRVRSERTPKCSVCDGYWYSSCRFSCKRCNFHLDLGCASLPKSVTHECPKHDWKAHPLQLTYGGIPDASGIYFCDMCEESRVLSHWFYDCEDCVWSNHPHCVLGRFQFKYGKTYKFRKHDHKVQLVKKAPSRYDPISCGACHKPLTDDSALFCSTCNLYSHIYCWSENMDSRYFCWNFNIN